MRISPLLAALLLTACVQPNRLVRTDAERVLANVTLTAPNPAERGTYEVGAFTYGSGTDKRRAGFRDSVLVRTRPVNGTPFLRGIDAKAARKRWKYWGFNEKSLPLNGRVWYPEGDGPFPLVLIVHGNHDMKEFSDPGYEYLGRHLASRGFITVSVDQNFINGGIRGENDARGWLLLKHLEAWRGIAADSASTLRNKVDFTRIALMGHSRGGEAVAVAAGFNRLTHYPDDARVRFDFGFDIRSVIAIAPVDGQYRPADRYPPVQGVNYFVIHGSHDADVSVFGGQRTYLRADVSDTGLVKAGLYVYRANHGQFNTVWGDNDVGAAGWLLNKKTLLTGDEQRQVGLVFFTGFLEMTLRDQRAYEPMFRDYRTVGGWLPQTMYVSSFADGRERVLADFEEDIDVTTGSMPGVRIEGRNLATWHEAGMRGRSAGNTPFETNTAVIGWTAQTDSTADSLRAWYAVRLPADGAQQLQLATNSALTFGVVDLGRRPSLLSPADTATPRLPSEVAADSTKASSAKEKDKPKPKKAAKRKTESPKDLPADSIRVDLTVALELADGRTAALPLSAVATLRPPLTIRLYKYKWVEKQLTGTPRDHEYVLQRVEIPFARFAEVLPGFAAEQVTGIRFSFDRTAAGTVLLDDVGFVVR
jgi:dienelactone hydrolase